MKNIKFNYIATCFALIFFGGCSLMDSLKLPSFEKNTNKPTSKQGWANYYYGVTPCASCSGIETWLLLKHTQKKNSFSLVENYLEERDGVFMSKGEFTLKDNVVKLISQNNQTYLRINNNSASFVKSLKDSVKPEYTLDRLKPFKDGSKTVLVIPKSVKKSSSSKGSHIEFNALTNFVLITSHNNKSLKAHYIVDCKAQNSYTISKGLYYKEFYAIGTSTPYTNKNMVNFKGENDAIRQAQKLYCK